MNNFAIWLLWHVRRCTFGEHKVSSETIPNQFFFINIFFGESISMYKDLLHPFWQQDEVPIVHQWQYGDMTTAVYAIMAI